MDVQDPEERLLSSAQHFKAFCASHHVQVAIECDHSHPDVRVQASSFLPCRVDFLALYFA